MVFRKLFDITVYETANFEVSQDWEVPIPGFFIVAPKRKVSSIVDFSDKESKELMDVIRKIRKVMKDVLKIKEVSLFQDEKTKFNFHIWILPRYNWMDKVSKGIGSLLPILKYAKDNMGSDKHIKEVEKAAQKVKEYLIR